jgi:hypothetical protein
VVLASGCAYLVDPDKMVVDTYLTDMALGAYPVEDLGLVIINSQGTEFEAHDTAGLRWSTRRVSWDGIQNVRISGKLLSADTWSAPRGAWITVTVDLVTGKASGGAWDWPDDIEDEQLYVPG